MNLSYTANRTFAQVHTDTNKYLFIRGAVGSGKSSGCIWHILLNALKQPVQFDGVRRSRYGILRSSYPALKSTVIKSWLNWFKSLITIVYDVPIRGTIKLPHPDGQSKVEIELVFIALDRDEDVNKLQSLELSGAHLNEAAEIPRSVHQMLKSRVNRYPDLASGGAIDSFIIADYNSVPSDHWLYAIAEEEKPPQHSFYVQPPALLKVDPGESEIRDVEGNCYIVNPDADNIANLDVDYYVNQVFGAEPDWISVMILNNYGQLRSGRPVYPEYLDHFHYNEKLIKPMDGVPLIIGVDMGLTPAAAFTQLSPMGSLGVFDEIVTEDCSIQMFCEDYLKPLILNKYPKHSFILVLDPAAAIRSQNDAKAAAEVVRDAGLPYRLAKSNNPIERREAVITFLRKVHGFGLGPNCPYIRKGFISEFKFEKKRTATMNVRNDNTIMFKEKWEKNAYSHVAEALQYAAMECLKGRTAKKKSKFQSVQQHSPADFVSGY